VHVAAPAQSSTRAGHLTGARAPTCARPAPGRRSGETRGRTTIRVPGMRVCEDLVDRAFLRCGAGPAVVADRGLPSGGRRGSVGDEHVVVHPQRVETQPLGRVRDNGTNPRGTPAVPCGLAK
jgi:hypothetical protein